MDERSPRTTRNLRRTGRSGGLALAAATVAATALLASACGSGGGNDARGGTPGTPTTAARSNGSQPTGSLPTGSQPTGSQPTGTSDGAYPSAITDRVVDTPAFAPLGRDISRRITEAGLPGASLLVLHNGELVHQQAYGSYDLATRVPIASASKWLAGATIMTLVDEGLIALDEPIGTYLPDATGASGRITMRQLLAFTSGLEYDAAIPCYEDRAKTLAECNREILALPLIAAPGTGYRYTGTHLHVAAGVAEAVTGKTWEQLFQERIAQPLGMSQTTFTAPLRGAVAADGHPTPAGSAFSTLGDYGRFLEMLVHDGVAPDGTRLLTQASLAEMSRDQTGDAKFVSAAANRKAAETPYGIAHWLDVVDDDGKALVESSPGKMGFRPWIDHVNGIAGVYLIFDQDDTHISDAPDSAGGTAGDVQTSGDFVLVGSAKAVGGTVPQSKRR